jgi:hypothetical protein
MMLMGCLLLVSQAGTDLGGRRRFFVDSGGNHDLVLLPSARRLLLFTN